VRRPAAQRRRDEGLAKLRIIRRWVVVLSVSAAGVLSAVLSHALPGRAATPGSTAPTTSTNGNSGATATVVPSLQPPTQAPAAAPQANTTLPVPPPVRSGGS
jgi:hypothetical protein